MSLPEGWRWKDPKAATRPWRAMREGGVHMTIEGETREDVVEVIVLIEAARAALDHRARKGWAFNHHSGFVD